MNLSKDIIGCDRCLGQWIKVSKVKDAVAELKENMKLLDGYKAKEFIGAVDVAFGEALTK